MNLLSEYSTSIVDSLPTVNNQASINVAMLHETIGELVKRRREELNLTQEHLADLIDMSQRWVSNLESGGVKQPKPVTLSKLARSLNLQVSDFVIALGYASQEREAQRVSEVLTIAPDSAEAQLLPYIRAIEWDNHPRELAMIKRQLEFIAEVQRVEHDR